MVGDPVAGRAQGVGCSLQLPQWSLSFEELSCPFSEGVCKTLMALPFIRSKLEKLTYV